MALLEQPLLLLMDFLRRKSLTLTGVLEHKIIPYLGLLSLTLLTGLLGPTLLAHISLLGPRELALTSFLEQTLLPRKGLLDEPH